MKNIEIAREQHKQLVPYFKFYLKRMMNIITHTFLGIICISRIGLIWYSDGRPIVIYPQVEAITNTLHLHFDYQSIWPSSSSTLRFLNRWCDLTSNSETPVLWKYLCANLIWLINYDLNNKFHNPDTHDFTKYNKF